MQLEFAKKLFFSGISKIPGIKSSSLTKDYIYSTLSDQMLKFFTHMSLGLKG